MMDPSSSCLEESKEMSQYKEDKEDKEELYWQNLLQQSVANEDSYIDFVENSLCKFTTICTPSLFRFCLSKAEDNQTCSPNWKCIMAHIFQIGCPIANIDIDLINADKWFKLAALHGSPSGQNRMGHVSMEKGDYTSAIHWYTGASTLMGKLSSSRTSCRMSRDSIGLCYLHMNNYEAAFAIFSELLKEDNNDSWAVARIARCFKSGLGCPDSSLAARSILENKDIWKTNESCAFILLEIYDEEYNSAKDSTNLENRIDCIIMVAQGYPHLFEEMIKKLEILLHHHSDHPVWEKISIRMKQSIINPHNDYEHQLHKNVLQMIDYEPQLQKALQMFDRSIDLSS